jgi:hypothetical protein
MRSYRDVRRHGISLPILDKAHIAKHMLTLEALALRLCSRPGLMPNGSLRLFRAAGLPVETTGAYAWPRPLTSSTKSCARTGPGWSNASFASSLRMRARRASAGAGAGTGAGAETAVGTASLARAACRASRASKTACILHRGRRRGLRKACRFWARSPKFAGFVTILCGVNTAERREAGEAAERRAASEPTQAACPAPPVDRGPDLHGAGGLAARDAPHPAAHDAAAAVAASTNRGRRRRAPAGRPRGAFPSARCAGEPIRGCRACSARALSCAARSKAGWLGELLLRHCSLPKVAALCGPCQPSRLTPSINTALRGQRPWSKRSTSGGRWCDVRQPC